MTLCGVSPKVDHSYVPILSVFIGLAAIFVVLRFLARLLMKMKLWWDDWFNFAAMVGKDTQRTRREHTWY